MPGQANEKQWGKKIEFSLEAGHDALKVSSDYLKSRAQFLRTADNEKLLKGNDNFIGRIAEMLAILHFRNSGIQDIRRPKSKSQKGVDLMLTDKTGRQRFISVKCITHENTSGRSSRIRWAGDDASPPESPPDNFEVWLVLIDNKKYCIHDVTARCRRDDGHLKYTYRSHVPGHPEPNTIPFSQALRQPGA